MDLLFGFSGRIGRLQWWLAQLAMLLVMGLCGGAVYVIASNGAPLPNPNPRELTGELLSVVLVVLASVVLLVWINAASSVKRFHDRNKSGYWFLIIFIPWIGGIWQIVECGFLPGTEGMNDYGPSPGLDGADDFGVSDDGAAVRRTRPAASSATPSPAAQASAGQPRRAAPSGFGRRGIS